MPVTLRVAYCSSIDAIVHKCSGSSVIRRVIRRLVLPMVLSAAALGRAPAQTKLLTVTAVNPSLPLIYFDGTRTWVQVIWTIKNTGTSTVDVWADADCGTWCDGGGDVSEPWTTSLPAGQTTTFPFTVYYNNSSPATNTVSLTVTPKVQGYVQGSSDVANAQLNRTTMTATFVSPYPTISVTPTTGTTVTTSPVSQLRVDWCDPDDALVQHDLTWQGQALASTYTPTTRAGCYAAGTSTYNNLAINLWRQNLVATARDAAGHTVTSTTTITYSPPLTTFRPTVTASPGWHNVNGQSSDVFTVKNSGTYPATYVFTAVCDGSSTLSNCYQYRGWLALDPGVSDTVRVYYTRSGALDFPDTLKLVAGYTSPLGGVVADTGRKVVISQSTYTPVLVRYTTTTAAANGRRSFSFYASDNGNAPATYTLTVTCSGALTTCTLPNSAATMTKSFQPQTSPTLIAVGFNTGAIGSTGQIRLVMTAPPRPSDGVVQADTVNLTVNAADVTAPTVAISEFGQTVTLNGEQYHYVLTDTATITVSFCDSDGTLATPTFNIDGRNVTAATLVPTTSAGCFTSTRGTYVVAFGDGLGTVNATASDGHHSTTATLMYKHSSARENTPHVTALHPTIAVAAGYAGADTFVVTNPGLLSASYTLQLICNPNPYWLSCGMDEAYNSVTVASGASVRVPFFYNVSSIGSSNAATLIAEFDGVIDTTQGSARFTASAVGTLPPTIAVTPANGTTVTSSPITQLRIDWCDPDDAIAQHTATWQGQSLPDTYVATTRSGCYAAGTSTYDNLTINAWQQSLDATASDIAGHIVTTTTTITYSPPLATFAPHVTPGTDWHKLPPGVSSAAADTFTVTNTGSNAAAYALTAGCGGLGTLSSCVLDKGSLSLAAGASDAVIMHYTRSGASDLADTLRLFATYTSPLGGVVADTGRTLVIAPSSEAAPAVAGVQPVFDVWRRATVGQAWFTLRNPSTVIETYTLDFSASAGWGFMTTAETPTLRLTQSVGPGQTISLGPSVVTASTSGVTGTISLAASYVGVNGQTLSGAASVQLRTIEPSGSPAAIIAVSPKSQLSVAANTRRSQQFTISNAGSVSGDITYVVSCSGPAIASCGAPDHSSATILGDGSDAVTVSFTTAAGTGLAGTVELIASGGVVPDTGYVRIATAATNGPITISSGSQVNPGTSIARDQCLTIAAGDDAAYECGDLRLVHPLPATTTLNKARTPTLIYTSAHAHPVSLIQADVTIDGTNPSLGGACPTQVTATVRLPNSDSAQRAFAWNGPCGQTATRRVVVPVDVHAHSLKTGVYHYSLEARVTATGTTWPATDTTGTMVVVDREQSPFGAGWWLDGLEQLIAVPGHPDQLLWIGGDGSTRVYTQRPGTNVFLVQPTLDRPDTLEQLSAGAGYRRHLRNGAFVQFDGVLHHTATSNALGHTTQFFWTNDQLDSLLLPVPNAGNVVARRLYRFSYTAGVLNAVTAPQGPDGIRVTTLTRSASGGGIDLQVADPGAQPVHYLADGQGRVTSRTNRLADRTRYEYDPTASVLTHLAIELTRTSLTVDSIGSTFCPAEGTSILACANTLVDPFAVRTLFDGPRLPADVRDTTAFYLNRFGAPRLIIDALGHRTTIDRTDSIWTMLATRVTSANGHQRTAAYHPARALTTDVVDLNPLGDGRIATTHYSYHGKWDQVTGVTSPEGVRDSVMYDATLPRPVWMQHGLNANRRDSVFYDPSTKLPSATKSPLTTRDSIEYDDVLGNAKATRTSAGYWTLFLRDGIGRDTLTQSAIDSADMSRDGVATARLQEFQTFDIMDHVRTSRTVGPTESSGPQTMTVHSDYDPESRLTRVSRRSDPDINAIDSIVTKFGYDAAGRKTTEVAADGNVDSTKYDPAGNATAIKTRRGDVIAMQYDALNRLATKTTLTKSFAPETLGFDGWAKFPRYPIGGTSGVTIPGDLATFLYDDMGNITTANNGDAQVSRTYNPNGSLHSETQRIRTYTGADFSKHVFTIGYGYDLDGRRTRIDRDLNDPVFYGYVPSTGELQSVQVTRAGATFTFDYDDAGRLAVSHLPGAITETNDFDGGGRLIRRVATGPNYLRTLIQGPSNYIHGDTLTYDGRDKVIRNRTLIGSDSTHYTGLGAVEFSTRLQLSGTTTTEHFVTDALGNIHQSDDQSEFTNFQYYPFTGRLRFSGDPTAGTLAIYDSAGNQTHYGRLEVLPSSVLSSLTRSYYGVDGKLRVVDRQVTADFQRADSKVKGTVGAIEAGATPDQLGALEEYRYDAFGRRVLKRSRRTDCEGPCQSAIERYVWDGDNLLREFRRPGRDGISADSLEVDFGIISVTDTVRLTDDDPSPPVVTTYSPYYGSVTYTHAGRIDRPLMLERADYGQDTVLFGTVPVVLHYNFRGIVDEGTFLSGQSTASIALKADWPGTDIGVFGTKQVHGVARSWFGGLPDGMRDATGFQYRRNRYYDPVSGRFTQEDPIGLAGGLNAYGFANGDPVNYSDPFGLWPCPELCGAGGAGVLSGGGALIEGLSAGGPAGWVAIGGIALVGVLDYIAGPSGEPALSTRAAADASAVTLERRTGRSLKKEWEGLHGQPWPAGCVAHHDCPLADGGKDEATNIIPLAPDDHIDLHKSKGDFKRWGSRSKKDPESKPDSPKDPQPDTQQ